MAIQKMIFFKIVGSIEDMHQVLQRLILSEKLHFDVEHADVYDNSYIVHEFESVMGQLVVALLARPLRPRVASVGLAPEEECPKAGHLLLTAALASPMKRGRSEFL